MRFRFMRRLGALGLAVVCTCGAAIETIVVTVAAGSIPVYVDDPSPGTVLLNSQDTHSGFAYAGLWLCAGASAAFFYLDGAVRNRSRFWLYWAILAMIGPISFVNFFGADALIPRDQQVVLDLGLVFGGLTAALSLLKQKASAVDAMVAQYLAVALLLMNAVFIPGAYAIIWLGNAAGAISRENAQAWGGGWISWVSGLVSLLVAGFQILRKARLDEDRRATDPR